MIFRELEPYPCHIAYIYISAQCANGQHNQLMNYAISAPQFTYAQPYKCRFSFGGVRVRMIFFADVIKNVRGAQIIQIQVETGNGYFVGPMKIFLLNQMPWAELPTL